jgi:hypothetical protein
VNLSAGRILRQRIETNKATEDPYAAFSKSCVLAFTQQMEAVLSQPARAYYARLAGVRQISKGYLQVDVCWSGCAPRSRLHAVGLRSPRDKDNPEPSFLRPIFFALTEKSCRMLISPLK